MPERAGSRSRSPSPQTWRYYWSTFDGLSWQKNWFPVTRKWLFQRSGRIVSSNFTTEKRPSRVRMNRPRQKSESVQPHHDQPFCEYFAVLEQAVNSLHCSVADTLQCRSFIPVQLFLDTSGAETVFGPKKRFSSSWRLVQHADRQ